MKNEAVHDGRLDHESRGREASIDAAALPPFTTTDSAEK
jgi:hypothetical protein